jgi:hypothetical protein
VVTPYWCYSCWLVWQGDFSPLASHFAGVLDFDMHTNVLALDNCRLLTLIFLLVIFVTGTVHYIRKKSADKIRIRQLFGFFIWTSLFTIAFLCLQPQHFDRLLPILIVNVSPLAAHFIALTGTKITNAAVLTLMAAALLLTIYNLWSTSSLF